MLIKRFSGGMDKLHLSVPFVRPLTMNNWFLYVIRCKHGKLYTGITTDVERRFAEHTSNDKKCAKSLRGKTPLTLVMKKKDRKQGNGVKDGSESKEIVEDKKRNVRDG